MPQGLGQTKFEANPDYEMVSSIMQGAGFNRPAGPALYQDPTDLSSYDMPQGIEGGFDPETNYMGIPTEFTGGTHKPTSMPFGWSENRSYEPAMSAFQERYTDGTPVTDAERQFMQGYSQNVGPSQAKKTQFLRDSDWQSFSKGAEKYSGDMQQYLQANYMLGADPTQKAFGTQEQADAAHLGKWLTMAGTISSRMATHRRGNEKWEPGSGYEIGGLGRLAQSLGYGRETVDPSQAPASMNFGLEHIPQESLSQDEINTALSEGRGGPEVIAQALKRLGMTESEFVHNQLVEQETGKLRADWQIGKMGEPASAKSQAMEKQAQDIARAKIGLPVRGAQNFTPGGGKFMMTKAEWMSSQPRFSQITRDRFHRPALQAQADKEYIQYRDNWKTERAPEGALDMTPEMQKALILLSRRRQSSDGPSDGGFGHGFTGAAKPGRPSEPRGRPGGPNTSHI